MVVIAIEALTAEIEGRPQRNNPIAILASSRSSEDIVMRSMMTGISSFTMKTPIFLPSTIDVASAALRDCTKRRLMRTLIFSSSLMTIKRRSTLKSRDAIVSAVKKLRKSFITMKTEIAI